MSVKLGDAIVFFRGDKRPLEKDQAEAKRSTRSWANKVGGLIKTGLAAGAAAAGTAVVGTLAAAGAAVKDAMPVEGIAEAFYSMADGAKLAELRVGSLNTVTDADLMESYNSAALLVSESFAEDLPNAMQYFGKISAATGEDIGFLMDSYVTGIGRLSPMILDNLKIQVDATQAYEDYADKIGVATEELSKEQQQLALSEQVMGLLADKTAEMPDITDNAATKAAQLTAAWGNFKDQVGMALMPVATQLLGFLAELAQEYGPVVAATLKQFSDLLQKFIWMLQTGVAPLDAIKIALSVAFGPEVGAMFDRIIGKGQPMIDFFKTNIPNALTVLQIHFNGAWSTIQSVVQTVVTWFQANLPLIQEAGQTMVDFYMSHVAPTLDNVWAIIQTIVTTAINVILNVITMVMQIITGDWEGAWTTIQGIAQTVWEAIKAIVTEFMEGVLNAIGTNLDEFKAMWRDNWEMAKIIVSTIWGRIRDVVAEKVAAVRGAVESAMAAMADAIDPVKQALEALKSAAASLWNWISSHVFNFKISVPDLPDWATPGSPLPIHTAWKAFSSEMNRMEIKPRVDLGAVAALRQGMNGPVTIDRRDQRQYQFDLHGNYREQDEVSMADDVRFLAMEFGAS